MRHYVGYDNKVFSKDVLYNKVATYLEDFFPDFDMSNPFKNKYEYPYKYMNFECLMLVYKMDERLDLLSIGESKEMSLTRFTDYIINYIYSYNDEHGDTYLFKFTPRILPYVALNENYVRGKKIQARRVLRG
ncbi:MAG: hypothetical protein IH901_07765 [Proteobacteria bacterium]|nr:hypothetical protein [Pseudomonadota bacterium]